MNRIRTAIAGTAAALVACVVPAIAAQPVAAAGTPTLTTTKPYVTPGGPLQASGTGCTGSTMASVAYTSDPGKPEQNVFATDFPIAVDGSGAFVSTTKTVPAALAVGTVIQAQGACDSPLGTGSNLVTIKVAAVPSAPSNVVATAGNGQVSLSWTAATAHVAPITGYTVTPYIGAAAQPDQVFSGTATTETITGLTNGTTYTFKVRARSAVGTSAFSTGSNAATPVDNTTVPGAPTGVAAVTGQKSAVVTWKAPASAGGSSITKYVITPLVAGVAQAPIESTGTGTSKTVTVQNGVSVRFQVAATNAAGTGPNSGASTAVYAPWGAAGNVADSLYERFLGRTPTTTERSTMITRLNGGTTIGTLVTDFRRGTNGVPSDAATVIDPVIRLYVAAFQRYPDSGGLEYWVAKKRAGMRIVDMACRWAALSEWQRHYSDMSDATFVEQMYADVLGRPSDADGKAWWLKRLASGEVERCEMLARLSESTENQRRSAAPVDIAAVYIALTGRTTPGGFLGSWISPLRDGNKTLAQLATEIISYHTPRP